MKPNQITCKKVSMKEYTCIYRLVDPRDYSLSLILRFKHENIGNKKIQQTCGHVKKNMK